MFAGVLFGEAWRRSSEFLIVAFSGKLASLSEWGTPVGPRRVNRVHRSLSRPLTIVGAERKLFFLAMCLGAATFNLLNSLLGGLLIFFLLYLIARRATQTDPQIFRFLLSAAALRAEYDPMKFTPVVVQGTAMFSGLSGSSRYDETGSLNEQINLYGFIGPNVFLTKSGEVGVILEVRGVDYECLDAASIDGFTKRLESALRLFDENYCVISTCSNATTRRFPTRSTTI